MRIKTTEQFIEACQIKHRNFYDYRKVIYQDTNTKVVIICPKHGEFLQKPMTHRQGKGCPACGKDRWLTKMRNGTEEFIRRAKLKHGDKYDYSQVNYTSMDKHICIICPEHGKFEQIPEKHLMGQNCFACSRVKGGLKNRLTKEDFIKQAKKIHGNRYDYSKTEYVLCHSKLTIICKKHGPFIQEATRHIHEGNGCPACMNNCVSSSCIKWLNKLKIKIREYQIPNTNYKVDGYDPKTNTVYEYHGYFWHGHPDHYNPKDIHPINKKTYGELYAQTLSREQKLRDLGYSLIVKWG